MLKPVVCVPAKNEAERLPSLTEALHGQTRAKVHKQSLRTLLVLNNCTDDTRDVAQRIAQDLPRVLLHLIEVNFAPESAHVGSAASFGHGRGLYAGAKQFRASQYGR